ncbi:YHS domain-containing (seleno)protein [uncultured Polaribacter sp.]|uniref:YHS domain-containing (seleno)protein n=1 Tax=uncultured Polaribacter sp. TaxID=174711 RepID=UPI0026035EB7|nr:YHS domain-containing (seleno)protein [uncultured Polaribacter sp.]
MRNITLVLLFVVTGVFAQKQNYNLKKGYVAEGYDVVAYFANTAIQGNKKYSTTFDGVQFKFASKENLEAFKKNPKKYVPAYGGYCAYAIGAKAEKVSINPKTFEIRDGKLYLFYNSWGINTLDMWQKEGAAQLKEKADKNWLNIINK